MSQDLDKHKVNYRKGVGRKRKWGGTKGPAAARKSQISPQKSGGQHQPHTSEKRTLPQPLMAGACLTLASLHS